MDNVKGILICSECFEFKIFGAVWKGSDVDLLNIIEKYIDGKLGEEIIRDGLTPEKEMCPKCAKAKEGLHLASMYD